MKKNLLLTLTFAAVTTVVVAAVTITPALAQDGLGGEGGTGTTPWKAIGYFLAVALAAVAGTTAQSKAASAALEGIARNPSAADKIMTPMILGLALMESLVIFTLISVFLV